jgi:hypothetical protein
MQNALIIAFGTITAALIGVFASDLRLFLSGRAKINADLLGKWNCTWIDEDNEDYEEIQDIVTIIRTRDEQFTADAQNTKYGNYRISGRVSRSSLVTLFYEGEGSRQPIGGVAILELAPTRKKMQGYWHELNPERQFETGKVSWVKVE